MTYLLEKESGRFTGAFSGSDQLLGAGGRGAILYRAVPYPQISVVRWN